MDANPQDDHALRRAVEAAGLARAFAACPAEVAAAARAAAALRAALTSVDDPAVEPWPAGDPPPVLAGRPSA